MIIIYFLALTCDILNKKLGVGSSHEEIVIFYISPVVFLRPMCPWDRGTGVHGT
jgi:hypothetical protein